MTHPPIVRLTAIFVGVAVLAVAVFAAFYILGAIAAVIVCAALGLGLVALVGIASTRIAQHRQARALTSPRTQVGEPRL